MEEIEYKGNKFTIKANRLNVSRLLFPLTEQLNEAISKATREIISTVEYTRYSALQDEYNEIQSEIGRMKDLKPANEIEEKSKQENILQAEKHLKEAQKKLNEPILQDIQKRYAYKMGSARLLFINDPANVKIMCEALLEGDISVIQFDNPDEDYWKLSDAVRDFFLVMEQQIKGLLFGS